MLEMPAFLIFKRVWKSGHLYELSCFLSLSNEFKLLKSPAWVVSECSEGNSLKAGHSVSFQCETLVYG